MSMPMRACVCVCVCVCLCVCVYYSQLFGEEDPDQDVSPDTEDPELTGWCIV